MGRSVPVVGNGINLGLMTDTLKCTLNASGSNIAYPSTRGYGDPVGTYPTPGDDVWACILGITDEAEKSGIIIDYDKTDILETIIKY